MNGKVNNKREQVLEVASECFLSNGFDGTSVNVMARDAGISKESIYRYFGSKEELFKAVIERELEVYKKGMEDMAGDYREQSMEEALYHVAEVTLKTLSSDRTLALRRLIFLMAARGSKVGRHYYRLGPQAAYEKLEKIFVFHFDKNPPRVNCGPARLGEHFIAMVLHNTMLERECGIIRRLGPKEIKKRCNEAVEDFLDAFFLR